MAEIRCPMCGQSNPADQDVCQYCDARLKPLTAPLSNEEDSGKESEWLGSLRAEGDLSDLDESDWVEEDQGISPEADSRDPLAWLDTLDEQTSSASKPGQPELNTNTDPSEEDQEGEEVDLEAWLASLDEEPEEAAPAEPTPAEELPEWLREAQDAQPNSSEEIEPGELPEWLAELDQEQEQISAEEFPSAETPPAPSTDEDLPEWLDQFEETSEVSAEEVESGPSALDQEGDYQTEAPPEDEGIPEWLREFDEETQSAELEALLERSPDETDTDDSAKDRLDEFLSEPPSDLEDVQEQQTSDWLNEFDEQVQDSLGDAGFEDVELTASEHRAESTEAYPATGEVQESGVPHLDAGMESQSPDQKEEILPTASLSEEEETLEAEGDLDWLEGEEGRQDSAELFSDEEEPDDWLAGLASEMKVSPDDAEELFLESEGDEVGPFTMDEELDQDLEDIFLEDEPDWLTEATDESALASWEETDEDIEHAELPVWLAAMRPVDSIETPQAEEEAGMEVESAGPLAGLRDVLPAEPDVFQISKPDAISVKLDVNEGQKKHILMLETMLKHEDEAVPIVSRPGFSISRVIRWVLAAVLLTAAVFGAWTGFGFGGAAVIGPEIQEVNRVISNLSSQDPVLISFDYEPGISAEMDVLATLLLDQLMQRGTLITLLSTNPTGTILAENVIQTLHEEYNYVSNAQYVNLGFLPGEGTGLQSLASLPMRQVLPYDMNGYEVWEPRLNPLAEIEQVTDFAAVLIITDRQESGRAWIEQVGPILENTPLLMATSAQIGPLVRPYYEGSPGLVNGYLSGLAGGRSFEQLIGMTETVQEYWNVYTLLVLVSVGLMLLGGIVNFLLGSRDAQSSSEEEGTHEPV